MSGVIEKVNELLDEPISCHPSREEYLQIRNTIRYLATEIERIKNEISRCTKDRPNPKGVNPYKPRKLSQR
jgi:hypothetical protein